MVVVCLLDPRRILGVQPGQGCLGWAALTGGGSHVYSSNRHKLSSWMAQCHLGFSTSLAVHTWLVTCCASTYSSVQWGSSSTSLCELHEEGLSLWATTPDPC